MSMESPRQALLPAGRTLEVFERAAMRIPSATIAQFNPDFFPPEQERTRLKTARMMAVTICLLMEREFSQITVNEITEKSGCSTTSLYARFRDKEALIPAVQYVISYIYFKQLDAVIATETGPDATAESFIHAVLTMFDDLFHTHRYFFKAALMGENRPFHQHTEMMMVILSRRVHEGLLQIAGADFARVESVEFALRIAMSVFRDQAIAGDIMTFPDTAALARLVDLMIDTNLRYRHNVECSPNFKL